jgi:hypothetical protein
MPGELDHGIDYRVEVSDGQATRPSLDFYVQLKGSRRPLADGTIVIGGLHARTLSYWRSKLLPVLAAVVHLPTRQLLARWFDGVRASADQHNIDAIRCR